TLFALDNLAKAFLQVGRFADGLDRLEDLWKRRKNKLGPAHEQTLATLKFLCECCVRFRHYERAEPVLAELFELRLGMHGSSHPETVYARSELGVSRIKLKKYVQAEPLLRESLELWEAKAPEHWMRFDFVSMLGGSLLGQKKYKEAEPLLLQ